eukprot:scaffold144866_cov20-Prasinocladus_malaysianus.AAC.1
MAHHQSSSATQGTRTTTLVRVRIQFIAANSTSTSTRMRRQFCRPYGPVREPQWCEVSQPPRPLTFRFIGLNSTSWTNNQM